MTVDVSDINPGDLLRMTDLRHGVTEPVVAVSVDAPLDRVVVTERDGTRWSVAPAFLARP